MMLKELHLENYIRNLDLKRESWLKNLDILIKDLCCMPTKSADNVIIGTKSYIEVHWPYQYLCQRWQAKAQGFWQKWGVSAYEKDWQE